MIEKEYGPLKLGWVVYEEIWPVANDLPGWNPYWFDGSREKLHLREHIFNRVSDLLHSKRQAKNIKTSNDEWFEMIYLCRDSCENEEEIERWELPSI